MSRPSWSTTPRECPRSPSSRRCAISATRSRIRARCAPSKRRSATSCARAAASWWRPARASSRSPSSPTSRACGRSPCRSWPPATCSSTSRCGTARWRTGTAPTGFGRCSPRSGRRSAAPQRCPGADTVSWARHRATVACHRLPYSICARTVLIAWVQGGLRLSLWPARHSAIRPWPDGTEAHLLSMSARHWSAR